MHAAHAEVIHSGGPSLDLHVLQSPSTTSDRLGGPDSQLVT